MATSESVARPLDECACRRSASLAFEAGKQTKQTKLGRGCAAGRYGLIAAGISVAIIAAVLALGTNLNTTFTSVSTALK